MRGPFTHKLRHPLRVLALGTAAFCAASTVTGRAGSIAAVVGTALGVVTGEILGRRRLRMWLVTVVALALGLFGWWLGSAATKYEFLPDALGPSSAIRMAAILRFGVVVFAIVTLLRALARRRPSLAVLELVLAAGAFAIPFAAHRDGVMIRPLWLSDWAWHKGIDPAFILLAIGGGVAAVLALLMMFESERRPSAVSYLALPAIAAIAALVFALTPAPQPRPTNDLGLTTRPKGDPPLPTNGSGWHNNSGSGSQQQGSGGGQRPQYPQGSGGGQGSQQQNQGSGGQGSGGGGTPPPSESDWQEPSEGNKSAPMAVVLLGDDYTPPEQAYYFRQESWSQWAGSRLVAPRDLKLDPDLPREELSGTKTPLVGADKDGMMQLHADVALLVSHRRSFFLGAPTLWESLRNPDPQRFVRVYRFESVVSTLEPQQLIGHQAGALEWPQELLDYYLAKSPDPRFQTLAEEIVKKLPDGRRDDPYIRAASIKLWMDDNVSYSTKSRHANVADPTADYLFGDRIGYCVHQAHAAVLMFRAVGVPARIGVGYAVEADNRRGSSIMIRGGDAHAWPEIYLRDVGWVILDISPKKNLDPPGQPPDEELQIQLAELARDQPPDPFEGTTVEPKPGSHFVARAALGVAIALAAILLVLYSVKGWRRLAPRFAGPAAMPRVGYRAALDVLTDRGQSRSIGETREKFAGRVADVAPVFVKITDLHVAAKLGPPDAPQQSKAEWKQLLGGLRGELRGKSALPWWKRLLNTLNPISFRASR
jgi:transglutaminase-like putative cysteine protease